MKGIKLKEWEEYDLYEDATLDKYNLEEEAERHPHIVQKWLELLSQAQAKLAKSKEVLANVEAKLFLTAKTIGVQSLGSKPTESTVKAWVHTQPEFRKAQRRKRKAENDVQYLQNARSVLEHKKLCLKVETDLWICGFFSRPKSINKAEHQDAKDSLKKAMQKRHKRQEESNGQ